MTREAREGARRVAVLIAVFSSSFTAWAEYPEIHRLHSSDERFLQHQSGVQEFYRKERSGKPLPPLIVYSYAPREQDTLFTLAARLSIPYSSLSSLNRIENHSIPPETEFLLIPGVPGLFIPAEPSTQLEQQIFERIRPDLRDGSVRVVIRTGSRPQTFYFLPGEDFSPDERLSFLRALFRFPVERVFISSRYGYRQNPFTGGSSFHSGVDLVAPEGSPILAAASGVVTGAGYDPIYGRYLVISHNNGYETFYGHLKTARVELNQNVSSGMIIATVGTSGLTTGPHLHFEIRLNGRTRDPLQLLPGHH
jgi:murein DD-endopeptidase MepM/ murein hydrolase activator NlpD